MNTILLEVQNATQELARKGQCLVSMPRTNLKRSLVHRGRSRHGSSKTVVNAHLIHMPTEKISLVSWDQNLAVSHQQTRFPTLSCERFHSASEFGRSRIVSFGFSNPQTVFLAAPRRFYMLECRQTKRVLRNQQLALLFYSVSPRKPFGTLYFACPPSREDVQSRGILPSSIPFSVHYPMN
jgi:hypothetical protein